MAFVILAVRDAVVCLLCPCLSFAMLLLLLMLLLPLLLLPVISCLALNKHIVRVTHNS